MSKTFKRERGVYGEVAKSISKHADRRKQSKRLDNDLRTARNTGDLRRLADLQGS